MGFRTRRLLAALGLASFSTEVADAARNGGGRDGEARGNSDGRADKTRDAQESNRKNDSKNSAESKDAENEAGRSGKQQRNQERTSNEESTEQNGSGGGKNRSDSSRRNGESDSTSHGDSSADGDPHRGDRSAREFAQKADEPLDDVPDATTRTPANPNVVVDDIPDTSINDLVVQGNEDVIATVSTSGGFAFARSGDVVAVTGPDGASIIQTGDVTTGTNGAGPTEPSADGGNNNVDFAS
jgi:hypothetical protein